MQTPRTAPIMGGVYKTTPVRPHRPRMRDADDTASWVTAITTIANYALLIVVGFLRDLLCGKGRAEVEGYAPLLNDWQVSLRCPRRIPT